jgi:alkanesulfonate monooxygenase SsuD/methylene tetrahydromethanopterin reductase-like flavin-dependent oxidoreductase (luciferase family)
LAVLAAVAAVTHRVRLVTAALLLPTRDEAVVAKQAAVIDQISDGRLDLGVAVGARPEDFELVGRPMSGRGRTFERQVVRLLELWTAANETRESGAAAGPGSIQQPHPALWIGGYTDAAIERAVRYGDGYLFGAPGLATMAGRVPLIRAAASTAGRSHLPIGGLAYVLPSRGPDDLAEGERLLVRYYGPLTKPFTERVHTGSPEEIGDAIRAYEQAGLDVLHLIPVSRDVATVERLATGVLPAFADAATAA